MPVGAEFCWLKVWKGQVNRGFCFRCKFVALEFSCPKSALLLKVGISCLLEPRLKHSDICGS
ncbi:hypothetical protein CGK65_17540 [Vibrio parahaemolyticus]|nr:hypothetical protein CGK65_17540 [Vibrio parahaemolyticus]